MMFAKFSVKICGSLWEALKFVRSHTGVSNPAFSNVTILLRVNHTFLLVCGMNLKSIIYSQTSIYVSPDHLILDSARNLGPLISRLEINKFENCWCKSVRILELLKLSC